jgi:LuxR family transcriptional regulator, maltose regulon positive regulatory protein
LALVDRTLATKMAPPRLGVQLIDRPRLWECFNNYHNRKLTLISAPPGYGKTVLLSQLANRADGHVTWYQLDPLDNDLAFFFQNLITGIARQLPDFEPEILSIVKRSPDLAKEARRIAAMMASVLSAAIKDELLLIIDDYHTINEMAIHVFIENLLEYLPDKVHMVLAGRTKPPFSLTRLKLSGLVKEISPEELRFTRDEIADFLQIESGEPILDQLVSLVDEKTAGWPAALRLASLSMASTNTLNLTDIYKKPLNNTELYRYLATEVMDSITEEMSHFLCELSVFEFFTVKICDLFWEQGNFIALLDMIERMNLFSIVQEGDELVYSFHPLFREFLQSRLIGDSRDYIKKAGNCYLAAGYPIKAIEYFLQANDFETALPLVENLGADMLLHSQWQTFKRWLSIIPEEQKSDRPWLNLYEGAVSLNSGHLEHAAKKINEAETAFYAVSHPEGLLQSQLYRARLLRSQGQFDESINLLENLLPKLAKQKVSRWYGIILEYSLTSILQGRFRQTARTLEKALSMAEDEGDVRIVGQLTESLGFLYYARGNFSKALEIYQRAEEIASEDDRFSFSNRDSVAAIITVRDYTNCIFSGSLVWSGKIMLEVF